METLFIDRILACSDCHSEFIFTAGEQLFFHDKQFKNDPKRCKPCKSRRSGLAAAANGTGPAAAGISRTETRTECSDCKVETTVPFKPTQGRPVLCRQCFQAKARTVRPLPPAHELPLAAAERAALLAAPLFSAMPGTPGTSQTVSALTEASLNTHGETLSPAAAILAAASMSAASPESSVATAADLASILDHLEPEPSSQVPTELLVASQALLVPAELLPESAEA